MWGSEMITGEEYADADRRLDADEKERFSRFFRKHYPSLLFYATRFLDRERAEDVVQDAFAELWRRRAELELGERLSGFMYRSVYTKSINLLRRDRIADHYRSIEYDIQLRRAEFMSPGNNEVLRIIENKELAAEMDAVIGSLPAKCREVFKLSYLHNMKNKEIADILNISVKTVEAHMYKALKLLRARLEHVLVLLAAAFFISFLTSSAYVKITVLFL